MLARCFPAIFLARLRRGATAQSRIRSPACMRTPSFTDSHCSPGRVGGRSRTSHTCSRSPSSNHCRTRRGCRLNRAAADWGIHSSSTRSARRQRPARRSIIRWLSRLTSRPAARQQFRNEGAGWKPFQRRAHGIFVIIDIPCWRNSRFKSM